MLSQDWHSTSAIAQARLALLLTHLTDEQEKQSGEGGHGGYRVRSQGQACDIPEPTRCRSLAGWEQAGLEGTQGCLGWGKHWEPLEATLIHKHQLWLDQKLQFR